MMFEMTPSSPKRRKMSPIQSVSRTSEGTNHRYLSPVEAVLPQFEVDHQAMAHESPNGKSRSSNNKVEHRRPKATKGDSSMLQQSVKINRHDLAPRDHTQSSDLSATMDSPNRIIQEVRRAEGHSLSSRSNGAIINGTASNSTNTALEAHEPQLPLTPTHIRTRQKGSATLSQEGSTKKVRALSTKDINSYTKKDVSEPIPNLNAYEDCLSSLLGSRLQIKDTPMRLQTCQTQRATKLRRSVHALSRRLEVLEREICSNTFQVPCHETPDQVERVLVVQKKSAARTSCQILSEYQELCACGPSEDLAHERRWIEIKDPLACSQQSSYTGFSPFSFPATRSIPKSKIDPPTTTASSLFEIEIHEDSLSAPSISRPHIEVCHNLSIYLPNGTKFARLNVHVNTTTQQIDRITQDPLCEKPKPSLSTYLARHTFTKDTTIHWLAQTVTRYIQISSTRFQSWQVCQTRLKHLHLALESSTTASRDTSADKLGPWLDISTATSTLVISRTHSSMAPCSTNSETHALLVRWDIILTSDGKVQSKVDARARFPVSWESIDTDGELMRIPSVFQELFHERGVAAAVIVLANLLFPMPVTVPSKVVDHV